MRIFLILFCVITSFTSQAEITTGIVDLWEPSGEKSAYLALASDGHIYEIPSENGELVQLAQMAKESQRLIRLSIRSNNNFASGILNKREEIEGMKLISGTFTPENNDLLLKYATPMDDFSSSVVSNLESAQRYFNAMRSKMRGRSQCYNRAHVWAFELYRKYRLKSNKVWIFFTRKYINRYDWKWWFHVSPSVEVAGQDEEIVLDRKFTNSPLTLTQWKNKFIRNNYNCPLIDRYSQYANDGGGENCFILKSSMYYWQPYNLENLEKGTGEIPNGRWLEYQLDKAYRNGVSWFHGGVDAEDL